METQDIRKVWLESTLKEAPVTIPLPGLEQAHLIIRELSGDEGSQLMDQATIDGKVDQKHMLAGIIILSLRNADDPAKSLIFSEADRDFLFSKGFGNIMIAAKEAIKLSGMGAAIDEAAKNASAPASGATTTVEGSLSSLPTASDTPTPTP